MNAHKLVNTVNQISHHWLSPMAGHTADAQLLTLLIDGTNWKNHTKDAIICLRQTAVDLTHQELSPTVVPEIEKTRAQFSMPSLQIQAI